MKTAIEAYKEIGTLAAEKAVQKARRIGSIKVGENIRQGDVYVHRVEETHPKGKLVGSNKLAIGEGEGSNHFAEGAGIKCYEGQKVPDWLERGTFLGPVVVASGPWMVTHPRHACFSMPAGVYQVTHQMDARTRRRVQD